MLDDDLGPPPPPAPDEVPVDAAVPKDELSARWQGETHDPTLSDRLAREVASTIADLQIDATVLDATCRASLCRLELRFASAEQAHAFRAATGDGDMALAIRLRAEDAGLAAEVYLP
ncbi:MAG TPA: hypothetical protein VFZ61_22075, partial [Polyangiales bacterium]